MNGITDGRIAAVELFAGFATSFRVPLVTPSVWLSPPNFFPFGFQESCVTGFCIHSIANLSSSLEKPR
jgi:hypothetical protein